jgi:[acyl-carrier-protein] S-malonyltransferase
VSQFAYVFPGQGSQSVGMGAALFAASDAARAVLDEADAALGEPISRLVAEGPAERLDLTVNAQPALLAVSIAYLRALEASWSRAATERPAFLAGHSMGQYSAMVAAGVITLSDGMRLVRERGRQMQDSAEGGAMAAIIGLDDGRLPELVAAGGEAGVLTVANRNSPGQVVISGERPAVERACVVARELGAKRALVLPVSVAAHSPLMGRAAEGMRRVLADVEFRDPVAPLLANADARPLTTGEACREELVVHLTSGVDWVRVVEAMRDAGVTTLIEVGPGKVLTGLDKRIAPELTAVAIDAGTAPGGLVLPDADVSTAPSPA